MINLIKKTICKKFGHKWVFDGGRPCPKNQDCSQSVYRCARCGEYDYGYKGDPSYIECFVECTEEYLEVR